MSEASQRDVSALALALERRLNVFLCVYDYSGAMSAILPPHISMHRSPFCRHVIGQHLALCQAFDWTDATRRIATQGNLGAATFIKRCHADVVEAVVPISRLGTVVGVAIAGPMRPPPTYDDKIDVRLVATRRVTLDTYARPLRDALPVLDEALATDVAATLAAVAARIERLLHTVSPVKPEEMDRRWRVEALLAKRFMTDVTIADVADELSISKSRARRLFVELFGATFSDHLRRIRVRHAERLLASTDIPVGQVAAACGYKQGAYFHNVFRRVTGSTPLEFRRRKVARGPSDIESWGNPGTASMKNSLGLQCGTPDNALC